ncbi:hypothetical protein DRO29_06485 [Candidatus Bathyarchaeota archaeon]|nr:MAG: hypothetical protein DRO29_06485 [Candidatus Bathyarchaeota archaeon]
MPREYPEYPILSVAAVAIKDNKMLLVKRGAPPGEGLWSIPGGAVELGERLHDALKRELREETNLECEIIDLVNIAEVIIRDEEGKVRFHYVILDYLVKITGGELRPGSDVLDAKWFDLKEAQNLPLTKTTRKLIKKLLNSDLIKTT